jgi:hypothetical protein
MSPKVYLSSDRVPFSYNFFIATLKCLAKLSHGATVQQAEKVDIFSFYSEEVHISMEISLGSIFVSPSMYVLLSINSVADPDPGSCAFWKKIKIRDPG